VPCDGPDVCALGRSFHSWQATSHALQPMQVLVSMYFATVGSLRSPVPPPGERPRIGGSRVLECHQTFSPVAFSTCTRKVLNSGVQVFGSIALGSVDWRAARCFGSPA